MKDKLDAFIEELHKSIALGHQHLFMVKSIVNRRVELVHFLALLRLDVYTMVVFDLNANDEKDSVLQELLQVGKLVWASRPQGKLYFQEVTFENEAAKTEYAEVLERLFKPKTDFKRFTDIDLTKESNPRGNC